MNTNPKILNPDDESYRDFLLGRGFLAEVCDHHRVVAPRPIFIFGVLNV
jgi:hypothetical protein